jgi:DNA-binding transcriptional LysR family regulator
MDRLTLMSTFAAVVSGGSFAVAARRLNMSPASASARVHALEERLGARLLNRSTRKLSLTEAGRLYYEQCCAILAQLEAADASISALNAVPRGTLRVNASTTLAWGIAPLIGSFMAAYPEVAVELLTSDRMADIVDEGFDVAIRLQLEELPSSLITRSLGRLRVILCASPAYLEAHGTPRQPADLTRHNCIAYMHPGYAKLTREWRLEGPDCEIIVPISGTLHTNNSEALLAAALDGRGISMAGSRGAYEALCTGRLVQVLPEYHAGELPIIALYPHRQHLSAKVRSFVDFAAEHFAESAPQRSAIGGEAAKVEPLRR